MSDNVNTSPLGIERTERIAGDEAINNKLDIVTAELQNTQTSVTTEVVHRSEGDLVVQRILEGYIKDLLDGKADDFERYIEFQNSQNLNYADVRNFVSGIRTSLADEIRNLSTKLMDNLQANDARYNKLVSDVGRYLEILSDITLDSNQITLDNGELRAGAWTILSQAREWDLEIISRLNGLTASVGDSLKDAVEEIQNQLPSTEATISKAIEELSKSPIVKNLTDLLNQSIENDIAYAKELVDQAQQHANAMAQLAEDLRAEAQARAASVEAFVEGEVTTRIQEINKEVSARKEAINLLTEDMLERADEDRATFQADMAVLVGRITSAEDGLSTEIQHRKDGDSSTLTELRTYKISNDNAVTGMSTSLLNNINSTDANSALITGLTSRMNTAEAGIASATTTAADALSKATTAVDANSALATRVDSLSASLTELEGSSVDANAFNTLKAEVTTTKGEVASLVEEVSSLESKYTTVSNDIVSQGAAISTLNLKMTDAEGKVSQSANDITLLKTDISSINSSLATKADSQALSQLSSDVSELDGKYTTQAGLVTDLRGSLDTTNLNVSNAASAAQNALNTAGSKGKVIFGSDQPGAEERLSQNLWIDTTGGSNTPKRWNGSSWVVVTDKVASDALAAANDASALVSTKADASALTTLDTKVTNLGEDVTSQGGLITQLTNTLTTLDNKVSNKAESSALNTLDNKVTTINGKVETNASSITTLQGEIAAVENELSTKASSSALSSLDSKVTLIDNKVSVTSNSLLNLEGRVTATENGITSKLDASVIDNYYTKTETEQVTAGQLTTFKSVFAQGGDNLLVNSNVDKPYNGTYPHGVYNLGEAWEVGATYTLLWCASFVRNSPDQNILALAAYAGGGWQNLQSVDAEGERQVHKVTFVVRTEGTHYNSINFYLLNSNGGYLDAVATVHWAVLVKASDVLMNAWAQSKYDINNAISANAQAIRNTETAVVTIDGKVTAQATDILNLNNGLINLNNSKLDSDIIQQYRTAVDQDSVTAGELTQFKSTLKVGGVNVLRNSKEPRSGVNEYLMYENSVELKDFYNQNLNKDVTISCEILVPVAGDVKIYTSNQSAHLFSFGTIVPANQWTRVVATVKPIPHDINPNWATSSLEFYGEYGTGRIVTVRNVQLEAGNFATDWSPSPRDYAEDADNIASALSETNTRVGNVENGIASQANQLTSLSAKLNERKIYQLYSGGLAAATGGMGWLKGFDPNSYYDIGRSYGLVVFNGDGSIKSVNSYDVWGGNTQGFIDAVAAVPIGTYVAVLTSDEPSSNKGLIKPSLRSLGGSDAIDQVNERCAYLLVGRKGLPTGQAIEKISNTRTFGVDYLLEMYNGVPIGLGGSSPQSDIISNMRTEVTNIGGNITSLSETVTSHTASLGVIAQGTYSKSHVLDLRGLDENLYYPVAMTLAVAPSSKLRIFRTLGSFPERPSWSTHGQGFDCKLEWSATGDGWGTTSRDLTIIANDYRWASAVPFLGLGQITESSLELIYLRGGAQYYLDTSSSASDPRIVTTAETHYGRSLAPMPYSDSYVVSAPDLKLKASAEALTQTRAEVQEIGGRVSSLSQQTTTLATTVDQNVSKLVVQGNSLDGIKAEYFIKTDVNGLVAGYGLVNGGTTSAFAVSAEAFFVGSPNNSKKPFMVLASTQTVNGVAYPAGTWIDTALIANATIGSAHIANASINDAHIVSLNASKITAGIIDADRIGANSISAEKLMVGDATNLWGNQHFTQVNPYPISGNGRTRWVTDVSELKGNGIQMWGRDHIAPYSTKIPLKAGDTFVIEYIAGRNGGPDKPLNVGLWTYNINGNAGNAPWQHGPAEQIANLGNGWFRWRRVFVVTNYGHTLPVAYGVLYFQIEQAGNEPNPAYWSVGDVTVRKGVGGELIVNGSVTADKLQVGSLSAISANLGTIKVGSANIADLVVDTLHIKDRAVTVPITLSKPSYAQTNTGGGAYTYISDNWYTATLTGLMPNGDVLIFLRGLFSASSRVTSYYYPNRFRLSIRLVLAANGVDIKNLYKLSDPQTPDGAYVSNITNTFGSSDFPIVNLVKADSSGNVTITVRSEHWSNFGDYAFDRSHSDVILHALELKK